MMGSSRADAGRVIGTMLFGSMLLPGPSNAEGIRANVPDIHMFFAATLSVQMEVLQSQAHEWSNVRQFELLCMDGECLLEVLSIATEYCNGKSRPAGPETGGVNHELLSNYITGTEPLVVEAVGKDSLVIKFRDRMLWGPTEEAIVVSYADKYPRPAGVPRNTTKIPTRIAGSATGLQASSNKAKSATYQELTEPMFCTVGFWPPGK